MNATEERPAVIEALPRFLSANPDFSSQLSATIDRIQASVAQVQVAGRGGGAGIIWTTDGKVLTNHHVVGRSNGPVSVTLTDGRTFEAVVAGRSRRRDLALLEIAASELPAAPIGRSSKLRVGELVFAVGHPWGQKGVATAGIVSGIGQVPADESGRAVSVIRSDVRLAPGNSGGPLLNAAGEVVGINSMIVGGDLSVAIPSDEATSWLARPKGRRGYLGVELQQVEVRQRGGPQGHRALGLLVSEVEEQGPSQAAGILTGDVLVGLNGQPTGDWDSLADTLEEVGPGSEIPARILRGGGLRTIIITVGERDSTA